MRPKLFSPLAVSAIALVGCSASETPAEPAPSVAPATAIPEVEPTPTQDPEDVFLEKVHQELDRHSEYFATAVPKKMLTDEALLKQGKSLCKKIKNGTISPNPITDDAGLADLEILVRTPAGQLDC